MSRYADVVRTSRFGSDCPGLGRLAVMANAGFPEAVLEMGEVQAIAKTLGIEVSSLEIKRPDDIPPAFDAIRGPTDALYVCGDPLILGNRMDRARRTAGEV